MKKLLHIVDMQNDFVLKNGRLAVAGAAELIRPANAFLRDARFDKTIATMDTHDRREYKNSDEGKMFPIHCIYGTRGWQSAIDIRQPYTIVKKNVFDVWQSSAKFMERELIGFDPEKTAYESYMMGDDHGGSPMGWGTRPYTVPATCEVYLFGVASDFCVRYAIDGYLKRGYEVFVITDLCRGIENQIDAVAAEFNNQKLHLITTKGATHAKQY